MWAAARCCRSRRLDRNRRLPCVETPPSHAAMRAPRRKHANTAFPCTIDSFMPTPPIRKLIIAIDGPAGAGKSTIAARLARDLGYVNLESGAMYRALALKAIEHDLALDDEAALLKLAQQSQITLEPTRTANRVLLDERDVSQRVREADVTDAASKVSVHPRVREWMVARQRELGVGGGVVMEGRGIGRKVFPDADLKVFLDAHPDVREKRRLLQQQISGPLVEQVAAELRQRDQRDRTRANSPLAPASDAVILDSTDLGEDEVLARIEQKIQEKMSAS